MLRKIIYPRATALFFGGLAVVATAGAAILPDESQLQAVGSFPTHVILGCVAVCSMGMVTLAVKWGLGTIEKMSQEIHKQALSIQLLSGAVQLLAEQLGSFPCAYKTTGGGHGQDGLSAEVRAAFAQAREKLAAEQRDLNKG